MSTFKLNATEMKDAQVSYISLVERGANRIPFRIIKQEKNMKGIDLANMGRIFSKKAEDTPSVVGVITMKSDNFESIKDQIAKAGFDIADAVENEDGSVIFKQEEVPEDAVLIRLSEHAVIAVKGFSPYHMSMESGGLSFADKCTAQGFWPGVNTVMDVLGSTVRNITEGASSPSDAAAEISKVFEEAKTYVTGMTRQLPAKAFKLEVLEVATATGAPAVKADEAPAEPTAPTEPTDPVVKAEGGESVPVAKEDAPVAPASLTKDDVAAMVAEKVDSVEASLSEKMEAMIQKMTKSVTEGLGGVTESVNALSGRVEKAELAAKAATEAVEGTVVGGASGGDPESTRKNEQPRRGGREIDTAFAPRRR